MYAHFDHPSDVLSAIFADNSVYPEFPPLSINAPCGCWNPLESSMVMGTENDNSFLDFPVFALNEYDTFWTIGKLSNNEPGNNPSWFSSPNVDGANICNSVVENGAVFLPYASHPTNPNAVAGDDLRIVIARITTCGDFEVSGAMQIFELGDQQNARLAPFSAFAEFPILGCTSEMACNYNPSANFDDGTCEFTTCGCSAEDFDFMGTPFGISPDPQSGETFAVGT